MRSFAQFFNFVSFRIWHIFCIMFAETQLKSFKCYSAIYRHTFEERRGILGQTSLEKSNCKQRFSWERFLGFSVRFRNRSAQFLCTKILRLIQKEILHVNTLLILAKIHRLLKVFIQGLTLSQIAIHSHILRSIFG